MLIQNAVMITENWPEVTFLVSSHVHDFRTHTFKDGTSVSVDGGTDYIRRVIPPNHVGYGTKWYEYCIDDQEPFYVIKSKLLWGTRGKDGNQPLKWVRLAECSVEHLQAILDYQTYRKGYEPSPLYKDVIRSLIADKQTPPKQVVKKPVVKPVIHKAARPKYHFLNPTLCADLSISDMDAQKNSRIRWKGVTCPTCLKLKPVKTEKLWDADPNCKHNIICAADGNGIKCAKCSGWLCY